MMTSDVLERYLRKELTIDGVRFQMIIKSHLEANAEIKRLGKVIDDMDTEIYLFKQDLNNPKER